MATFINGLDLCEAFFREAVQPLMHDHFEGLPYAAALIGSGSEVLGLDTEMSSDHHWGPRVMLFVEPEDLAKKESINEVFSLNLPRSFKGYPTGYTAAAAHDKGVQMLDESQSGPINHRVEINTLSGFLENYLGFVITDEQSAKEQWSIDACDWLTFPEQKLLSITAGRVFYDQVGLQEMRDAFAYYPHQVWLYLLASCWSRIEQEEHLMGRAGSVGDEIGSAVIAARLVRDMMRLCFLVNKKYAPYAKWFGTAFSGLPQAGLLEPLFKQILAADNWQKRQQFLSPCYEYMARLHNSLGISEALPETVQSFHGRPFSVISMGAFSRAISATISDPALSLLLRRPLIGNIDQISDNTDLLSNASWRRKLLALYSDEINDLPDQF